jgi:hypothetical protein
MENVMKPELQKKAWFLSFTCTPRALWRFVCVVDICPLCEPNYLPGKTWQETLFFSNLVDFVAGKTQHFFYFFILFFLFFFFIFL